MDNEKGPEKVDAIPNTHLASRERLNGYGERSRCHFLQLLKFPPRHHQVANHLLYFHLLPVSAPPLHPSPRAPSWWGSQWEPAKPSEDLLIRVKEFVIVIVDRVQ